MTVWNACSTTPCWPAATPKGDGNYFYYSDYHSQAKKGFYHRKWPCCSGTYVQAAADYLLNIYFCDKAGGIYVNLFTPSEVRTTVKNLPVKLIQSTNYPLEEEIEIRVETRRPVEFVLNLRMPGWLESQPKVTVNGKAIGGATLRRSFTAIHRQWKNGDEVHLRLPLTFRTERVDDRHPTTVAVMRGPTMMVALDPAEDLHTTPLALPGRFEKRPGDVFEHTGSGGALRFTPFYSVRNETYNTYFLTKRA